MIENCAGCKQISGETNQIDENKKPFFLCAKCVAESESINCCEICNGPVNEDHEDYETIDTYLEGNYEDTIYLHINCRYEQDQLKTKAIQIKTNAEKELKKVRDYLHINRGGNYNQGKANAEMVELSNDDDVLVCFFDY